MKSIIFVLLLTIVTMGCAKEEKSPPPQGRFIILETFYMFDKPFSRRGKIIQDKVTKECFLFTGTYLNHLNGGAGITAMPCPEDPLREK